MKDANRGQSAELFQMETKQIGRRTSKRIIEPWWRSSRTRVEKGVEKEPRHLLIGGTLFNYVSSPSPACFHCFLPRFWRTLHRCNQKQTGKEENKGSSVNSTDVNSMRRIYPHHQVLKQLERAWTESELSRLLKPQYPPASPNRHRDRCLFPNRRLSNRDSFKEGYERDYDCQLTYIYDCVYTKMSRRCWRKSFRNYELWFFQL